MGGKQKRAAKYKKWMEAQNLLKQNSSQGDDTLGGTHHDGSGDSEYYEPIPYHVQQEILKHRAKKSKKYRSANNHWILRKLDHMTRSFNRWMSWPCTICIGTGMTLLIFVILRSLIQMFVPPEASNVDRSSLYNGLRMALPGPLYKFIRIFDYLFTSPTISMQGISSILHPPEEYFRHRAQMKY